MSGISYSKLYESWAALLPRGAVVMARQSTTANAEIVESGVTEATSPMTMARLPVIAPLESHASPFLQRMLGSIGVTPTEFECVDSAQMKTLSFASSEPVLIFAEPGMNLPLGDHVFILPSVSQIQADAAAKRQAWEELKRLAKRLGKTLPSR